MTDTIMPNAPSTANDTTAVPSLDSIAAKMTAMKQDTLRNQIRATEQPVTGADEEGISSSPVAPEGEEVLQPEVDLIEDDNSEAAIEEPEAQDDSVSSGDANSTADELIDFIEFAETNPNAKFKFMRNGKEVIIDAKKAAAILGQGGAIHEEARQLKIQKSEFDEFLKEQRAQQEGLTLAMEFTVQPQLQRAYDEILKTQNYQATFQQQLAQTTDPSQRARIQASMQQNERYIQQQSAVIGQLKPAVDQFRDIRRQQVEEILTNNRRQFKDKELKNEYVYNEIREKVAKGWEAAKSQLVPGVDNIDLIASDEHILSLLRDGLKYRDRPRSQQAGSSIAALTSRKSASGQAGRGSEDSIAKLREQAKGGDKKAADNLLMAQLNRLRSARTGR